MKRIIIATAFLTGLIVLNIAHASTENQADDRFAGWTEEQYRQYEDSILAVLYPPVILHKLDNPDISAGNRDREKIRKVNSHVPTTVTLDKTKAVGEIPVESGSMFGAKTYRVPIEVYPGIRNFQPDLSLNYNSYLGNSTTGTGWTLSGVSAIVRGCKSVYYDGKTEGVAMDNSDAFTLDGMRLLKTGTASGYIIYQSERDNIKVKGHIADGVMKYFEVFYPDGSKGVFGYPSNTSNRLQYPVTALKDAVGNTISYSYTFTDNNYNIEKISYNGSSVEFGYINRPDTILSYTGGLKVCETKLLQSITPKFGNNILRTYNLDYTVSNSKSFLSRIDCSANGESLNPLQFYYGSGISETSYDRSTTLLTEWYPFDSLGRISVTKGKFDYFSGSDGLIMHPKNNPYWKHVWQSGTFSHSQKRFDNYYKGDEKILLFTGLNDGLAAPEANLYTEAGFIDILCADLEGKQEEYIIKINNQVVSDKDQVTFKVYKSSLYDGLSTVCTRTYSFPTVYTDARGDKSIQPKFYYTGDFNGDGKMEILAVSAHEPFDDTSKPSNCYVFDLIGNRILYQGHIFPYRVEFAGTEQPDPTEAAKQSDKLFMTDYDGDGKTDLCHIDAGGIHIYTFEGSSFSLTPRKVSSTNDIYKFSLESREILLGEFNGDGMVDMLLSSSSAENDNQWTLFNSKGNGYFEKKSFTFMSHSEAPMSGYIIQDIDKDGISDLIAYSNIYFATFLPKNNTFSRDFVHTNMPSSKHTAVIPSDINNRNCFTHLLCVKDSLVSKFAYSRDDKMESLLTGMVNSLGIVERNSYTYINIEGVSDQIYTKGYGAVFPFVNIQEPLPVVSKAETFMDGNIVDQNIYEYHNAVINRQGLGFCGFEKITVYDRLNRPVIRTYDPYKFCVLKSETTGSSEKQWTYNISTASNKTTKILPATLSETDLLTGISADISYTYNSYGYPTKETKQYSDGIKETTTTSYLSKTDIDSRYDLETPTSRSVTVSAYGTEYKKTDNQAFFNEILPKNVSRSIDGNLVKFISLTYDSIGNVVQKSERLYSSFDLLKTKYTYDSYSRLLKETDPLGFVTEYTYDSSGRLSATIDKRGHTTSRAYDAFGREISVTNPDNTVESVLYQWSDDGDGALYSITKSATGKPAVTTVYDALNREIRKCETSFNGTVRKTDRIYDFAGNLQKESLPFKGSEATLWNTYEYDSYDRLLSLTEASGRKTTYSYDATNVTTVADGISSTKSHDALGNVISVTDPAGTITYNLEADGQPSEIIAPGNVITGFSYDKYRRRIMLSDPSAGDISYEYDDKGNLTRQYYPQKLVVKPGLEDLQSPQKQISRLGETIFENEYDEYNRIIKKTTGKFSTAYTYSEYGDLSSAVSDNGSSKIYTYDQYGRLSSLKETAPNNIWLKKDFTYTNGNISSIRYTSQTGVLATESYTYTNGHKSMVRLNGSTVIFSLKSENDLGLPTRVQTGSYIRNYTYTTSGLPVSRSATYQSTVVQNLSYKFNSLTSNLLSRTDNIRKKTETFTYDGLNRLVSYSDNDVVYDNKGNIISKSDVGSFEYTIAQKPYAISGAELTGDAVPSHTQNIAYTSFSRPDSIVENGYKAKFIYNDDFDRVKMEMSLNNSVTQTRHYIGGCYEMDRKGTAIMEKLYLCGGYYEAPVVVVKSGSSTQQVFIFRDYTGSITHLYSVSGNLLNEFSYDPWGRLRNPRTLQVYAPDKQPDLPLGRGYTGHEHLPQFGLINMNARLYDPVLGRFLSPDPYVQAPDFSQNFNRYSYALNNPLRYNDPEGEFFIEVIFNAAKDLFTNVFKHGLNVSQYDWKQTINAWRIDMGMFKGNFMQILNKWTWGFVNSYVGNKVAHCYNSIGKVDGVTDLEGMLALSGATPGEKAVTIGHYSMGPKGYVADWRDHMFVHEYGHYIQSQYMGISFLPVVGVPSLLSAFRTSRWSGMKHDERWFERWANKLGGDYFDKKYGSKAPGYVTGSPDYFDLDAFKSTRETKYFNPRNNMKNPTPRPTSFKRLTFWDFIL